MTWSKPETCSQCMTPHNEQYIYPRLNTLELSLQGTYNYG